MQIKISHKRNLNISRKQLLLAVAFLLLLIVGSKIDINLGGLVSFTLQTLFLGLAYYFLPRNWKLAVISVYLILGIAGLPVFNGGSGWSYFTSWPLGFFIGFVCAAFITEPSAHNFYNSLAFFLQVHVVILTIGIIGVGIYTTSFAKALDTCLELLPGVVVKSLIGAMVIWIFNSYQTKAIEN